MRRSSSENSISPCQRPEDLEHALGARDHQVRLGLDLRRALLGEARPTRTAAAQPRRAGQPRQRPERVEVRAVVAGEDRRVERRVLDQEAVHRRALVDAGDRAKVQDLAPPERDQVRVLASSAAIVSRSVLRLRPRRRRRASGAPGSAPCPRWRTPRRSRLSAVEAGEKLRGAVARRAAAAGSSARLVIARQKQLEPLIAEVDELGNADHPPRLERPPPGHAGDQGVTGPRAARATRLVSRRHARRPRAGRRSGRGSRRRRSGPRSARAQPERARGELCGRRHRGELVSPARVRRPNASSSWPSSALRPGPSAGSSASAAARSSSRS